MQAQKSEHVSTLSLLLFGVVADLFSLRNSLIIVIIPLLFTSLYGFGFKFLLKKNNE